MQNVSNQTIKSNYKVPIEVKLSSSDPMFSFLEELNSLGYKPNTEQWEAIKSDAKRLLIHAGAGSGKTTTVIAKLIYFIKVLKIKPNRILCLTFTRKSAQDMVQRIQSVSPEAGSIQAGTFHSIFGSKLMKAGQSDLFSKRLLKESDRESYFLIRSAMKKAKVSTKEIEVEEVVNLIGSYKNSCIEPDEVYLIHDDKVGNIYHFYEALKQEGNRVDFDDILSLFLPIAEDVGKEFDVVIVDEFQDTSEIQIRALKKLAHKDVHLVCVGDPDQSIYGFRGASPSYILNFEQYFGKSHVVRMGINYRSHCEIVQAGLNVVDNNVERDKIELTGIRESENHPILLEPEDDREEANFVVRKIESVKSKHGLSNRNIAILYRSGYYAEPLITRFSELDIPFRLESDAFIIYDKPIVKAVLAMLKVRETPNNIELIKNFAHLCYTSNEQIKTLEDIASANGVSLLDAIPLTTFKFGNEKAKMLLRAIKFSNKNSLSQAVDDLIRFYLDEHFYRMGIAGEIQRSELEFLIDKLDGFASLDDVMKHANELREAIERARHVKDFEDAITLTTVHKSKGLEWECVVVVGLLDRVFPDKKSMDADMIEEERRLCYVALTRAREHLIVSSPKNYAGREPKRTFLNEIKFVK